MKHERIGKTLNELYKLFLEKKVLQIFFYPFLDFYFIFKLSKGINARDLSLKINLKIKKNWNYINIFGKKRLSNNYGKNSSEKSTKITDKK